MTEYSINILLAMLIIYLIFGGVFALIIGVSIFKRNKDFEARQKRFDEEFEETKKRIKSSINLK